MKNALVQEYFYVLHAFLAVQWVESHRRNDWTQPTSTCPCVAFLQIVVQLLAPCELEFLLPTESDTLDGWTHVHCHHGSQVTLNWLLWCFLSQYCEWLWLALCWFHKSWLTLHIFHSLRYKSYTYNTIIWNCATVKYAFLLDRRWNWNFVFQGSIWLLVGCWRWHEDADYFCCILDSVYIYFQLT